MWELQIGGVDLYHILNWLIIYSFLGWVWESSYVSIKQKKLVNRGFVTGPVCTIYGFGAVIVYLILRPISENLLCAIHRFGTASVYLILKQVSEDLFLLYLGGVVVPTILEYVTAVLMENIFHTRWWDYSHNKYNFQGRICLGASLGWGFFSIILCYGFQPVVDRIVSLYSVSAGKIFVTVASFLYAVDFGMSFMNAMQIGEKLRNMDAVIDELYEYMQSTKLFKSTEELRERIGAYRGLELGTEMRKRFEARIDAMIAFGGELPLAERRAKQEELKAQMEERIAGLQSRYEQIKGHGNLFIRRITNAYPNMKSKAQALRDRRKK